MSYENKIVLHWFKFILHILQRLPEHVKPHLV